MLERTGNKYVPLRTSQCLSKKPQNISLWQLPHFTGPSSYKTDVQSSFAEMNLLWHGVSANGRTKSFLPSPCFRGSSPEQGNACKTLGGSGELLTTDHGGPASKSGKQEPPRMSRPCQPPAALANL